MSSVTSEKDGPKVEEEPEPVRSIKQKCVSCLKGPNLLKTLVIVVCTGIVVQQVVVCVRKLINVPVTTYTHFDFNKTIQYPSITLCREPPYKFDKMLEYNLYAHPRYTSRWIKFNFSDHNLDEVWRNITYEPSEFFVQYGLNGYPDNVEIETTIGFMTGRCYTLKPKIVHTQASRDTGYSVTLQHRAEDVATSTSIYPPGYHLYVHYSQEPFTEVQVYNGGLVDYLYVNTGETVDVKLTVDQYVMISSEDDPCTYEDNYNTNNCTAMHVWDLVGQAAGCSGPWMVTSRLPRCANYSSMRNLIVAYMDKYNRHNTVFCPRICRAYLYNAFVQERMKMYTWDSSALLWSERIGDAELQSQLYIHFNSMMVPVYEESYTYDWNIFIADLGGSVGFLLGLSVIGLISIVGQMWCSILMPYFKSSRKPSPSVTNSTITIDDLYKKQMDNHQSFKDQVFFKKCNDWQMKTLKDLTV
ncbi:hypothetical protein O0L34_g5778 [Tuta absoluta]|nr:hypothetical protein O0L34_g5778 [Tuta absoluta]